MGVVLKNRHERVRISLSDTEFANLQKGPFPGQGSNRETNISIWKFAEGCPQNWGLVVFRPKAEVSLIIFAGVLRFRIDYLSFWLFLEFCRFWSFRFEMFAMEKMIDVWIVYWFFEFVLFLIVRENVVWNSSDFSYFRSIFQWWIRCYIMKIQISSYNILKCAEILWNCI